MLKSPKEIEDWHYEMQAKNLEPGTAVTIIGGAQWVQNRPLYCPWCGVVFYGHQRQDRPLPSYLQSENAMRQTCGHFLCWDAEVKRHMDLHGKFSGSGSSYTPLKKNREVRPAV